MGVLAGCAQVEAHSGAGAGAGAVDEGAFAAAGPWSTEFAESAADTTQYQRRVLSDGVISAQELAEAQPRTRVCMRSFGYDYATAEDGTSEASPLPGKKAADAGAVNEVMSKCASRFSSEVTYLFNEIRRNPEKQDEVEITVACLREAGLVDASYTERRWRAENEDGTFSFSEWDSAAVQCRLDPLGLWRAQ